MVQATNYEHLNKTAQIENYKQQQQSNEISQVPTCEQKNDYTTSQLTESTNFKNSGKK